MSPSQTLLNVVLSTNEKVCPARGSQVILSYGALQTQGNLLCGSTLPICLPSTRQPRPCVLESPGCSTCGRSVPMAQVALAVLCHGVPHTALSLLEAAAQPALDKSFQVTILEGRRRSPSPADLLSTTQISSMGLWELHGDSPPHP